jgi:putative hydrolase of the HAD superfamily
MSIRAVLFDLDGTLYDRDEVVARVAIEQWDAFADRIGDVDRQDFIARTLELDEHGYARRADLYRSLLSGMDVDPELAGDLERHFWDCYCRHSECPEDTVSTLTALRSAGKRLAVVTNGPTEWQSRKLRTLGLTVHFDEVVISESEGVAKPDRRIFMRTLDRLGVTPREAMFVGDHPDIDIAGAQDAGLLPVWKRVAYWTLRREGVAVIERLSEITQHLRI